MRSFNSLEEKNIKTLTNSSINMTYIEPTETGLSKSIMDATAMVRKYLLDAGIHDYGAQRQGTSNRVFINAKIITDRDVIKTKASLYRPLTKKGDPRIWIYGMNKYAKPNDIFSILVFQGEIFAFNLTRLDINRILEKREGLLYELVTEINKKETHVSRELLERLKRLSMAGPVKSLVKGDTGIGRTLENCLGIKMNPSKSPDYKGIELKSFRDERNNRKTLFAQVPDWSASKFKSSKEILENFGYNREGILKLYCTVSALDRNSQGLMLKLDEGLDSLLENSDKAGIGDFVVWGLDGLKSRLQEKHKETFWIEAKSTTIDDVEYFDYSAVEHTKSPVLSQLAPLIEQGDITVDHLIKRKLNGQVTEKGPLFKIKPSSIKLLFPDPVKYKLK